MLAGGFLLLLILPGWGAAAQGDGTPSPTPTLPAPVDLPAYGTLVQQCGQGVRPRAEFQGQGLIVTTFARREMWLVDLDRNMRYPLPDTLPCGPNCQPSPDRRRLLYVSPETSTFWVMNVDGSGRQQVFPYFISALEWWDDSHWLIWPAAGGPAIQAMDAAFSGSEPTRLADYSLFSVQPGGTFGLRYAPGPADWPILELVETGSGDSWQLAEARPFMGGAYWSPDGSQLAYLGAGERDAGLGLYGAELYLITPGEAAAVRATNLAASYGAVRIAGVLEERAVSWSPDGRYLAFWVMEIIGPDVAANVGHAVIHVLDTESGVVTAYCGFATNQHTPDPPGLIWSPAGQYIAFGVDVPGDERPALMLALDVGTGTYYEITDGMYAAYGTYDPVMWGTR